MAAVLGALIWWGICAYRTRRSSAPRWSTRARLRHSGLHGLLIAAVLSVWFIGEWPGHLMSDELTTLYMASEQRVDGWLSGLWGLWATEVLRLTGYFPSLALINLGVFSFCLGEFFGIARSHGVSRRWTVPCLLLLCTSIPFGLLAIYYSHDVFAAAVKLSLALTLLRVWLRRREGAAVSGWTLAGIGGLALAAALLRGENVVLLVYVPLALIALGAVSIRRALVLGLAVVLAMLVYRRGIEPTFIEPAYLASDHPRRYQVSLMVNPLGWILLQPAYVTDDPAHDRAILDAVIHWKCFEEHYIPYEISCFWSAINGPTPEEEVRALQSLFVRVVSDNPWLWLSNRVVVFGSALGMSPRFRLPMHAHREDATADQLYGHRAPLVLSQGLIDQKQPTGLSWLTSKLRRASVTGRGASSPPFWIWNNLPGFLFLVAMALGFRRRRMGAVLAGMFLAPAMLAFVAAPASHFKYYTDVYMFAFVALPLMRLEAVATAAKRASTDDDSQGALPGPGSGRDALPAQAS